MMAIPDPPILSARIGLGILDSELNRATLEVLATGSLGVGELSARLVLKSETTLREQIAGLVEVGAVERWAEARTGADHLRLTSAGEDLLDVIHLTGAWLRGRPGAALSPEGEAAWRAVAALGEAWRLALIQHLLLRPTTRADLIAAIRGLSRQKAKRLLRPLEGAGLVESHDEGKSAPRWTLTIWGRRAIASLSAVAYWERRHLGPDAEPISATDGAIALLASLPLMRVPGSASGDLAFTVEGDPDAAGRRACGVWARLENGRSAACRGGSSARPPDAWIRGDVDEWLDAVINARPTALHLGGDRTLAKLVLRGIHDALFGAWVKTRPRPDTIS